MYAFKCSARLASQRFPTRHLNSIRRYRLDRTVHGNRASTSSNDDVIASPVGPAQGEHLGPKQVSNLLNAYRRFGYLDADLDPLQLWENKPVEELNPELYGFDADALEESLGDGVTATGADFVQHLRQIYCGKIAVEFMHITDTNERRWFAAAYERCLTETFDAEQKRDALKIMLQGKAWEEFLAKKFPTLKRYSCEGAEAALALHQFLLEEAANYDIQEYIFDGAHRGRLALQTSLFQFPPAQIFRKIRGKPEFPDGVQGSGDVLTHQPSHFDYRPRAERNAHKRIHVSTVPNPSHLEVSLAVALGKCRARAQTLRRGDYAPPGGAARVGDAVLSVHHHGDGAFAGQGVVWESALLSGIAHFRVGGSVHVVANNQVAFTAERATGRSSRHCTDLAKALDAPVIHVNGEDVEKVLAAGKLALAYRQQYRKEVFINLLCYRRYGHNELDDPSFTQPAMYRRVGEHRRAAGSAVDRYAARLADGGEFSAEDARRHFDAETRRLADALDAVDAGKVPPRCDHLAGNWKGYAQAPAASRAHWDTGLPLDLLRFIGAKSVECPDGFALHPHLQRTHVAARLKRLADPGGPIDWSTAEALAFGSLLLQGFDVRLSGQDVGRATFSHRHAMLVDQDTDAVHIPLNHLAPDQTAFLEVANSPLTEAAIVGFEYGFAMESPRRLVLWEAQFGDFYNGAQVQIDTLLATGESKWLRQNGLVLVLPHGIDGMGPDHSSAHLERFLQLTDSGEATPDADNVNMYVVQPTTSAQYFHVLRRQMIVPYRKPLIIVGPKQLLRHPAAGSPPADFAPGTHFRPVVCDPVEDPARVRKVIFTSGKHAVTLAAEVAGRAANDAAIVRLECLCPFPAGELAEVLQRFPNAKDRVWSQEEPRNAGAWTFVDARFRRILGVDLRYAGRPALAWMATAIGEHHAAEARRVLEDTFA